MSSACHDVSFYDFYEHFRCICSTESSDCSWHTGQPSLTTPTAGLPSPLSSSLAPKLHAVKITSPLKGQQIPVGRDLTITGTSMDDATSATSNADCQVIIGVNQVKPYQPVIPLVREEQKIIRNGTLY